MKITADFTCLLKKEEQKIKEGNSNWNSSRQLTNLLFQLEEKDYDQAIDICREYKKESIIKELKSAREEYLNTDYDNLQERVKFVPSFQWRCLNPLEMPEYLVNEIEYRKSGRINNGLESLSTISITPTMNTKHSALWRSRF